MPNRRDFLKTAAAGAGALSLAAIVPQRVFGLAPQAADDPWAELPKILARIKPPVFPKRDFDITKYGAKPDGKTDCTDAIRQAIAACTKSGGGRVVVPQGEFMTGAVELKSNVNLYVSEGATLRFTWDQSKYPLVFTRWEGMECMNFSPFLYAFEQENIGITGKGTINGNADTEHWWPWKGNKQGGYKSGPTQKPDRDKLYEMVANGVPVKDRVFGQGHYLRPQFIQPYRCKNVIIDGVRVINSPMWQITPCLCENVTISNLYINSYGPNNDGCDPESCKDVLIKNCYFNTGDDCIAIKSGRNDDGRRLHTPSENIIIQGCHMKDGHGGITIGSEISGGCRNVFAEDCQLESQNLDTALRVKNNAMRGGLIENFHARNINIGQVRLAAITVDFNYEEGKNGNYKPVFRNMTVRNLKSQKSRLAVDLQGFKDAPVENVSLVDCEFNGVEKGSVVENVTGLTLKNVRINGKVVESLA